MLRIKLGKSHYNQIQEKPGIRSIITTKQGEGEGGSRRGQREKALDSGSRFSRGCPQAAALAALGTGPHCRATESEALLNIPLFFFFKNKLLGDSLSLRTTCPTFLKIPVPGSSPHSDLTALGWDH